MRSNIQIEYKDGKLTSDFGVIHRDRNSGNVIAHHYPTGKRLVWTEVDGECLVVSEHRRYNTATADWAGRCKMYRIMTGDES